MPDPLGRVIVTWDDDPARHDPLLVCQDCDQPICSVEEGDTLNILLRTVESHECEETTA